MPLHGNERVRERLRRAVDSGRVAHCYLFAGPDGIGKMAHARWLAQLLCCTEAERPCERCARCRRLAEGAGPDLILFEEAAHPAVIRLREFPRTSQAELDEALTTLHTAGLLVRPARGMGEARVCHRVASDESNADVESEVSAALKAFEPGSLPVVVARRLFLRGEAIRYGRAPSIKLVRRTIIQQVNLRPVEMPFRFFLVDEAHNLQTDAQNALLKTLEEPPPSSILILVTSKPDRLLPTIASRCQSVAMRPLDEEALIALLVEVGASEEDARLSARLAGGSALAAFDFDPRHHRSRRDALLDALEGDNGRAERTGALVKALSGDGGIDRQQRHREISSGVALLLDLVRDAIALSVGATSASLRHLESHDRLARLANLGWRRLTSVSELLVNAQYRLSTNASAELQVAALGSRLYDALAGHSLPSSRAL